MWQLLSPVAPRPAMSGELGGVGAGPPTAAQYQSTVKVRDDLAAAKAGGEQKLAEESTLQGLRQDLATLSQDSQDPRLEQASKLLAPTNPDLASRQQALDLLSAVAQERVTALDDAVRAFMDRPAFVTVPADVTVLQPMEVPPEPLPDPSLIRERPEFKQLPLDPAPPLVPVPVVEPPLGNMK